MVQSTSITSQKYTPQSNIYLIKNKENKRNGLGIGPML